MKEKHAFEPIMKEILPILLISLLCFCGCKKEKITPPPAITKGSISGVISPTGAALGVTASVTINGNAQTFKTTPDKEGKFKLTDLPVGNYLLTVSAAAGYTPPADQKDTVIAGRNTDAGTLTLTQKPGSLSGSVNPAKLGIVLRLTGIASSPAYDSNIMTDDQGNFSLAGIPPGNYTLTGIEIAGYSAPPSQNIIITAGQNTNAGTLTFEKIVLPGSLSGVVTPVTPGITVAAVTDMGTYYPTVVNADGSFKINNLPADKYHITVTPDHGEEIYLYSPQAVLVNAANTNIGTLNVNKGDIGYVTFCTVNGTTLAPVSVVSHYTGSTLTVACPIVLQFSGYIFSMQLNNMNGIGEYTCSGATGSSITLTFLQGSWSSSNAGAGVIVKITAFDPVTHHYSGTFSGTVFSADGTTSKTITDGIISDFQYQTP